LNEIRNESERSEWLESRDDEKKKKNNTTAIGIFSVICFASLDELWPFSIAGVSRDFRLFPKKN